jgi:cephalosporin hydroxylase
MRRCSPSARDALDLTDVAARRHRSSARGTLRYPAKRRSAHSSRYTYRGVPMLKNPFDLALYLLLLWRLKPRTVIEIGSKSGGSGP